jgi:hypothetical protein
MKMKKLTGRLSYANVVSTLCLFLLLGGGAALAASALPKNSVGTKQLKSGSVTPPKLSKAAKKTLTGTQGPAGPQGPRGERGEPGPLLSTLPSGATERGSYGFANTAAEKGGGAYTPGSVVSYPIPLNFKPTLNVIKAGDASTAACPGSFQDPTATPGNLCVYEEREDVVLGLENHPAEGHFGFLTFFEAAEGANYEDFGTWAVTAP